MTAETTLELNRLNKEWFESHKHIPTSEMLKKGLIDECDIGWVESLRESQS